MKRTPSVILAALCAAALFGFARGQVLVSGTVLNAANALPIPGLTVYLIDDEGQRLPMDEADERNVTDLAGRFSVPGVTPGVWYGIEIYSGSNLRFTDFVLIDAGNLQTDAEGNAFVVLDAPIAIKLQ